MRAQLFPRVTGGNGRSVATPPARDAAGPPNLLVVDGRWKVVLAAATDLWRREGFDVRLDALLPAELRTLISSAIESLVADREALFHARISPWPNIAVSIYPVQCAGESLLAISAQPFQARKNLLHAQREYGLSPREVEILRHVLSGAGTSRIAVTLNIADSTVIAHVKSLLIKTKAANRAALVARVLGWEEALTAVDAAGTEL